MNITNCTSQTLVQHMWTLKMCVAYGGLGAICLKLNIPQLLT